MINKNTISKMFSVIIKPPAPPKPPDSIGVLVVEDDVRWQDQWERLLRQTGVRVEIVSTDRQAQRKIETGQFDVLILDWNLHRSDGKLVLDTWMDHKPDFPSMVFSTNVSEKARTTILKDGAYNVIARPVGDEGEDIRVDNDAFARLISRYLNNVRRMKEMSALRDDIYGMRQELYKVKLFAITSFVAALMLVIPALIAYPQLSSFFQALVK